MHMGRVRHFHGKDAQAKTTDVRVGSRVMDTPRRWPNDLLYMRAVLVIFATESRLCLIPQKSVR